ncbi:MAG: c-type cytochrome [Gammaproteobacteria bacterium]|nr:c-type cytochrome [Gammaproteobacteria bacterium]MBV9317523.1 c-type cytochrome [Gammaproteobacteria bacterium]MBV9724459.1 c-type cytochrome [Gammaproteobacteria bacterium]
MGGRSGFAGYGVALSALVAWSVSASAFAQAPAPASPAPAPAAAAPAPAAAAPATTPGDPHRGKQLSYTCLGCHGIDGYRNAYPDYSVPKLEGQNPEYLIAALHGYREGDRAHLTMHSQASELSDQDIIDIAVFFAGKPLAPTGKAHGAPPKVVSLCTACHGQDGIAVAPMYPSLAGQHQDYLVRALEEYQHGGRKNPIMKGFAGPLKPAEIAEIAAYFSALTPALRTEPRPYTRFSAE